MLLLLAVALLQAHSRNSRPYNRSDNQIAIQAGNGRRATLSLCLVAGVFCGLDLLLQGFFTHAPTAFITGSQWHLQPADRRTMEPPISNGTTTAIPKDRWETMLDKTQAFVQEHMRHYDSSHDWTHIVRVVSLAHLIYDSETTSGACRKQLVTLAAYLHDIGDKKYLQDGQDPATMVSAFLRSPDLACPSDVAHAVQDIVTHVSYSNEKKHPESVTACLDRWPELAMVQDADRLDAIGAVGIGRCFTFSATQAAKAGKASGQSSMDDSIEHFADKLVKLEAMMKTATGRRLAKERSERIKLFQAWWMEEAFGSASLC